MSSKQKIVGIDLGTTFWEAAIVGSDGRVQVAKNSSGNKRSPTAIWMDGDQPIFGAQAKRMEPVEPAAVLTRFKPDLDEDGASFSVDSRELDPVEITSLFYEEIKTQLEERLEEAVDRAVITVPAFFHEIGYETMEAGCERAGFQLERILREPASAAIAYALDSPLEEEELIFVYDLGGGTFDVSVLRAKEEDGRPDLTILANRGDTSLGGKDFDQKILEEVFVDRFVDKYGVDPTEEPNVKADWLNRAEAIKRELSDHRTGRDFLQGKGKSLPVELTRDRFEELIEEEIARTVGISEKLLDQASVEKADLDRLVLVGGSTRIKAVRKRISEFLSLQPAAGVDPDLAVVSGAALLGGAKANQTIRDKNGVQVPLLESEIKEVVTHGLGIKAVDGSGEEYNQVLIEPGEKLPAAGTREFKPTKDDARKIKITILEGDSRNLAECTTLKEDYELELSTPKSAKLVRIQVGLKENKDGLIEVFAETEEGDRMEEKFTHPNLKDSKEG